jgi:putative molybdopterin biosynthesis protein
MKPRGVHLQYRFEAGTADSQQGSTVQNTLFDLLLALREHGSIQQAAQATGVSYRHLWGQLKLWQEQLGQPLVTWTQGQPARLTPFADRLLWAETRARARLAPHIEALRVELARVLADALDGTQQVLTVFASHDMALPLLQDKASRQHGLHIDLRFAGSLDALRALAAGRCLVAGFHVPAQARHAPVFAQPLKPLLKPGRHKLIGCATRVQGLMVAKGNPLQLRLLADVARTRARYVRRQVGSGTQLLLQHLLQAEGLASDAVDTQSVPPEDSHLAVAAAVASGAADTGLGIEAAAARFDLGFVPLIEEDYYLVCLRDALEHPAVQKLQQVLQGPAWRETLADVPGYSAGQSGQVLSLTRALPWWNFRSPKTLPRAVAAPASASNPGRDGRRPGVPE